MDLNGVMSMAEWCALLYQNCTKGIKKLQHRRHACVNQRRNVSTHWLTLSVCPSV